MGWPMFRGVVVSVILPILRISAVVAAEQPASERCVVVICHDARPDFVQLRWTVAGGTLGMRRRAFAERMFGLLDRDGDGRLQPEEARGIPGTRPPMSDQVTRLGASWRRLDTDGDGTLAPAELATYVSRSLGPPFAVQNFDAASRRERSIARLVDADSDGVLAAGEFRGLVERLAAYDTDLDETLSFAELTTAAAERERDAIGGLGRTSAGERRDPPRVERGALRTPSMGWALPEDARLAAYSPEDVEQVRARARMLVARYRKQPSADRIVLQAAPDAAFWKGFDGDGDGAVSVSELESALKSPPAAVVVTVHLPHPLLGRPVLELRNRNAPDRPRRGGTSATLTLGSLRVHLAVRMFAVPPEDAVRFYRLQFRVRDVDRNGYLGAAEFASLGLANVPFAAADADGNGQVTREELTQVVAWVAYRESCRLLLTIGHDAPSVLQAVDADGDRRWSRRELLEAGEALQRLDVDGDGRVEMTDLAGEATIRVELGRPGLFAELAGRRQERPEAVRPVVRERVRGPLWFQRMDRNRDGDVSRNEFVGPLGLFEAWDADGDGILTVSEAERVGE